MKYIKPTIKVRHIDTEPIMLPDSANGGSVTPPVVKGIENYNATSEPEDNSNIGGGYDDESNYSNLSTASPWDE